MDWGEFIQAFVGIEGRGDIFVSLVYLAMVSVTVLWGAIKRWWKSMKFAGVILMALGIILIVPVFIIIVYPNIVEGFTMVFIGIHGIYLFFLPGLMFYLTGVIGERWHS